MQEGGQEGIGLKAAQNVQALPVRLPPLHQNGAESLFCKSAETRYDVQLVKSKFFDLSTMTWAMMLKNFGLNSSDRISRCQPLATSRTIRLCCARPLPEAKYLAAQGGTEMSIFESVAVEVVM
jgi:hypothetical protein